MALYSGTCPLPKNQMLQRRFDVDALAFFNRATITDSTGKSQINSFVRGIKNLGLYSNMVAWPLRSTQNKGTGIIAYSLGGLGTFDGTLTNGPTWGTSGITFGTTKYISTALTSGFSEFSVFSITTPQSNSNMYEFAKDDGITTEFSIFQQLSTLAVKSVVKNSAGTILSGALTYTVSQARAIIARASSSVNKIRKNNESDLSRSSGTLTQASNPVTIGATSLPSISFLDTIHATILFNTALSDSNTSSVYNLYKTTLGQGLGLP